MPGAMGEPSSRHTEADQLRPRNNLPIISLSKLKDYMPQSSSSTSRPSNLIDNLRESDFYEKYVCARYVGNNLVFNTTNPNPSPYSTVVDHSTQSVRSKFINLRLNKNNMTPSSLLLLQNHNYIDQEQQHHQQQHQQQHQRSLADYNCDSGSRARASASEYFMSHGSAAVVAARGADLTTSSDAASNTDNGDSQQTHYHQPRQIREGRDDQKSVTNNSLLFSQYHDTISNNPSTNSAYQAHSNFTQPMSSSSEQLQASNTNKLIDGTASNRSGVFEDTNSNNTTIGQGNNLQSVTQSQSNLITAAQQHQAMTNMNQCYTNSHYNLMPTPSSKSTSPTSSISTPSPKTSVMHASSAGAGGGGGNNNNSNSSNNGSGGGPRPNHHIIASALANSSATPTSASTSQAAHLDQLNEHYVSESMLSGSSLQQHHQVAHNYTYGHAPASSSSLHSSISNHDQPYSHHQLNQSVSQQQQQQQQSQQQHHQMQHQQNQQQHHQQQQSIQSHQVFYQHMAHNTAGVGVNHIYGNHSNNVHYQGHLQTQASNSGQLVPGAHQNHLNTAAAARAAAAVVSQTLKTVTNQQGQHSHHHPYGGAIANTLGTGSIMNHITAPHHQHQFHHAMDQVGQSHHMVTHHHMTTNQAQQLQQASLAASHNQSIVTRKYQCKMCPQVFMSKAEMKYHNQNHMREAKPYKCLQCPKAFANSSYLSQHMRIHQGVKPYTCDICMRKFTQLSHLQQHKRTHTGDKPYKCTYMNCTKQFSQLSNLQSHSRCHQLDKPYKCNSCYKCFHDEQSLLEHIPRHLESKHLKKNLCIFCGSSYQQERGLVKHFQQYHTDKSPTLVAAAIAAGTTGNTSLIASLISSTTTNSFHPSSTTSSGNNGGGNNM